MTPAAPLLQVRNLRKSFGGIDALADVSFDLEAGHMLALIGPNGAGKSTCFNVLGGQLRPDSGSVRLDGRELVGMSAGKICRGSDILNQQPSKSNSTSLISRGILCKRAFGNRHLDPQLISGRTKSRDFDALMASY